MYWIKLWINTPANKYVVTIQIIPFSILWHYMLLTGLDINFFNHLSVGQVSKRLKLIARERFFLVRCSK
jgi:hypothetical protein